MKKLEWAVKRVSFVVASPVWERFNRVREAMGLSQSEALRVAVCLFISEYESRFEAKAE